jgi:hypothetical protein
MGIFSKFRKGHKAGDGDGAAPLNSLETDKSSQSCSESNVSPFEATNSAKDLYGIHEVVRQPADQIDSVDIIAIHGLNGHRDLTWTDRSTGINWLSDESCLRKDLPRARIMTFGYNSKTYFSRSEADVRDFASELLAAVKASRSSLIEQQRPIVFICHSLGGLVFKQVGKPWNCNGCDCGI